MSRTVERLIALVAIVVVAVFGYRLSAVQTCDAVNRAHEGTQVFLNELAEAFAPLDAEQQARVDRIEKHIQPEQCSWLP